MDAYDQALGFGSGFLIGPTAFVTNYHVIEGAAWVTVKLGDAEPVRVDAAFGVAPERDLAILQLPEAGPPLQFSLNEPTIGERVVAIGNPLGMEATVSEGIVSGLRSLDDMDFYQITSPISPGSSGGPVLNRLGQVIGVVTWYIEGGQNLNFAVPVAAVDELWKASRGKTVMLETLSVSPFESLRALLRQALLANPFMSALDWLLNRLW
jgi:S1-C subfamily serine protease